MGGLEKNKYIKMPAGKMKIQTNALIRDAETLLENVSRRWLLATAAAAAAARGHSVSGQQKGVDGEGGTLGGAAHGTCVYEEGSH